MSEATTKLTVGTRKSELALVQTHHVVNMLKTSSGQQQLEISLNAMSTVGDKVLDVALAAVGDKSLFTKELEVALAAKEADFVVHSLKDLPTNLPPGMVLGAILEREDPSDALVLHPKHHGKSIENLPAGCVLGTSSRRRAAQLRRRFPQLVFEDVRGNLNTRLRKLDEDGKYDGLVLARAGLVRLGWLDRISQVLGPEILLHAVGQGALGIECREGDERVLQLLATIAHEPTTLRCLAERAMMRTLEGGCSVPIGVWTTLTPLADDALSSSEPTSSSSSSSSSSTSSSSSSGTNHNQSTAAYLLKLDGNVHSLDGSKWVDASAEAIVRSFADAEALGREVARKLLEQGAREILSSIRPK